MIQYQIKLDLKKNQNSWTRFDVDCSLAAKKVMQFVLFSGIEWNPKKRRIINKSLSSGMFKEYGPVRYTRNL